MDKGEHIVRHLMFENDPFSQWLGIQIESVAEGEVVLSMKVRNEMCNGFGLVHGGICYSLADSALAFAANAHGVQSLSIETSIQHLKPVKSGDTLKAISTLENISSKFASYIIRIYREDELVALFKGIAFRTGKDW